MTKPILAICLTSVVLAAFAKNVDLSGLLMGTPGYAPAKKSAKQTATKPKAAKSILEKQDASSKAPKKADKPAQEKKPAEVAAEPAKVAAEPVAPAPEPEPVKPEPEPAKAVEPVAPAPALEPEPVKVVEPVPTNKVEVVEAVEKADDKKKPAKAKKTSSRPARITSATTYYDRKEGIIFFNKNVYVDDEQYQLHADKAYVFMQGTNEVRRIVAIGNVAMTNDTKRAYGAKVSYYKDGGMVVIHSGDGITAEVRDESKEQDQVVRGKKIKFWIDSEQVEVLDADIQAPTSGFGKEGLKKAMNLGN